MSPVDGQVLTLESFGPKVAGLATQVKGARYDLAYFLGEALADYNRPALPKLGSPASRRLLRASAPSLSDRFGAFLDDKPRSLSLESPLEAPPTGSTRDGSPTNSLSPGRTRDHPTNPPNFPLPDFTFLPYPTSPPTSPPPPSNPAEWKAQRKVEWKWFHAVIYLSPSDYHHFHSPCELEAVSARHFSGQVLPVKKSFASSVNNLFALNERLVIKTSWRHGVLFYCAVAAFNVADIVTNLPARRASRRSALRRPLPCSSPVGTPSSPPSLRPSSRRTSSSLGNHSLSGLSSPRRASRRDTPQTQVFEPPHPFKRGEEVGQFKLGSTIVLLFQAPSDFEWTVKINDHIKVGALLGDVVNRNPSLAPAFQPKRHPSLPLLPRDRRQFCSHTHTPTPQHAQTHIHTNVQSDANRADTDALDGDM